MPSSIDKGGAAYGPSSHATNENIALARIFLLCTYAMVAAISSVMMWSPLSPPRSVLHLVYLAVENRDVDDQPINCMMAVTKVQDSMRYAE